MVFIGKLLSGESFNAALNEFPDDTYRFHQHRIKDGFDRNYDVAMHTLPSNGFKTSSFMMSPSFLSFDGFQQTDTISWANPIIARQLL